MKKLALLALISALSASGCRSQVRREAPQARWTGEGVGLGLAVLNVYTSAALCDLIAFNALEFWSGEPVAGKTTRAASRGEAVALVTYDPAVPSLRVVERLPERPERIVELRLIKEGVVALNAQGRIIIYSRQMGSRIVVSDNEAHIIRVYEPDEAARLAQPGRGVAGR